jgi:hypothetical protein
MPFTGRYDPGYELQGRLVSVLRRDAELVSLLFEQRPSVSPADLRVYQADVHLPDADPAREVLPRIIVAVRESPWEVEQRDAESSTPAARCVVTIHVLAEADQRRLAEQLAARIRHVVVSTPLSDSSIIVAELVPESPRSPVREVAFRDAWRLTREYRTQLVGVL